MDTGWYLLQGDDLESGNLINALGGRLSLGRNHKILDVVIAGEWDWNKLNWSGTYYDDPDAIDAWLAPDGHWWGCSYGSHATAADVCFGIDEYELRETHGFARVHGMKKFYSNDLPLTEAQKKTLLEHGIPLKDRDKEAVS
jgi:hypothetical protein